MKYTIIISAFLLFFSFGVSAQKIGVILSSFDNANHFLKNIKNKEVLEDNISKGSFDKHTVFLALSDTVDASAASVAENLISKHKVSYIIFSSAAYGMSNVNINSLDDLKSDSSRCRKLKVGDFIIGSNVVKYKNSSDVAQYKINDSCSVPENRRVTVDVKEIIALHSNWNPHVYNSLEAYIATIERFLVPIKINDMPKYMPAIKKGAVVAVENLFVAEEEMVTNSKAVRIDAVDFDGGAAAVAKVTSEKKVVRINLLKN